MDLLYRLFGDHALPIALQCAVAAGCVLLLSLALTALSRLVALRASILAPTRERSVHARPIPLLGGTAIYLAFAIGVLLFEPLTGTRIDLIDQIRGLLIGATVAVVVGTIDDVRTARDGHGLRPGVHFLGQVLAVLLAFAGGLRPVQGIANPFSSLYAHPERHKQILLWDPQHPHLVGLLIAIAFTLFWIAGMMNTVNFLDGLDGLAGGVVTIAAILLAIWSSRVHNDFGDPIISSEVLVLLPLLFAAALIGFLCYNWFPASIFMGDSGAQFAGFTIGVLAILGPAKIGTALLILVVPILDIAWVFIRRPAQGRRFFSADREHLHHRLLDLGLSQRRIVLMFYAVCIALGVVDLRLERISKLLAFLIVVAATVLLLIRVARQQSRALAGGAPSPQRTPTTERR